MEEIVLRVQAEAFSPLLVTLISLPYALLLLPLDSRSPPSPRTTIFITTTFGFQITRPLLFLFFFPLLLTDPPLLLLLFFLVDSTDPTQQQAVFSPSTPPGVFSGSCRPPEVSSKQSLSPATSLLLAVEGSPWELHSAFLFRTITVSCCPVCFAAAVRRWWIEVGAAEASGCHGHTLLHRLVQNFR